MRIYEYLEDKEADELIERAGRIPSLELHIEIINFRFAPLIKILQTLKSAGELNLIIHRYLEINDDFEKKLKEFATILGKFVFRDFTFKHAKPESISFERQDLIVTNLCQNFPKKSLRIQKVSFQSCITDKTLPLVVELVRNSNICKLDLSNNFITNQGAILLSQSFHNNMYDNMVINLKRNQISDEGICALARSRLDYVFHLSDNPFSQKSFNFYHHFRNRYQLQNPLMYDKTQKTGSQFEICIAELANFLYSLPESRLTIQNKKKYIFEQSLSEEMSLEQLLRGDPRIWKKISSDHDQTPHKEIMICAGSALFGKYFAKKSDPLFFWQGNPQSLNNKFDENFVAAPADKVQSELDLEYPGRYFWVIDDGMFLSIIKDFFNSDYCSTAPQEKTINFILPKKDVDLSAYFYCLNDKLFQRISTGFSKKTSSIQLQYCYFLSPSIIIQILKNLPQLHYLGLADTQAWELKETQELTEFCPLLEELSIKISNSSSLRLLKNFSHLKRLYLDLSFNTDIRDLNFLKDFGTHIISLNISYCDKLMDWTGLQYCENLEELYTEGLEINNLDQLLPILTKLNHLKSWIAPQCEFPFSQTSTVDLIFKDLTKVRTCFTYNETSATSSYKFLSGKINNQQLSNYLEIKKSLSNKPSPMNCQNTSSYPKESLTESLTVSQFFWDSKGAWPSHRQDLITTYTSIKLNEKNNLIFSPIATDELELRLFSEIKILSSADFQPELLQQLESKNQNSFFCGEQTLMLVGQTWAPLNSRGVYNIPVFSSIELVWAVSQTSGGLYVRLPDKLKGITKKVLLKYIFISQPVSQHRRLAISPLPASLTNAFDFCGKSTDILLMFPKFKQFLSDVEILGQNKDLICNRVLQYCRIGTAEGFSDEPLDSEKTQLLYHILQKSFSEISGFTDNHLLLNTLLQQKGVCQDAAQCFKFLCDLYQIPCHIVGNQAHAFPVYALTHQNVSLTRIAELGGGEAKIILQKLPTTFSETKNQDDSSTKLEQHKRQTISRVLAEYKPEAGSGLDCQNIKEFWKQILGSESPLICLESKTDVPKILNSAHEYCQAPGESKSLPLLYIDHPDEYITLWDSIHVANNKVVPRLGLLQAFLLSKTPGILLINAFEFSLYDLMCCQGAGDKHKTFLNISVADHTKIVFIAPPNVCREEIFASRFQFFYLSQQLLADIKPFKYISDFSQESKIDDVSVTNMYFDASLISKVIGSPQLEGNKISFILGVLAQSQNNQKFLFTDIPAELDSLLRLCVLNQHAMINGEAKKLSQGIQFYSGKNSISESKNIVWINEIKTDQKIYYLNSASYPRLVIGERFIEPKTGLSYANKPLLLSVDAPDVIVITRHLSLSDWLRLVECVNKRITPISLYLCKNVKIENTSYQGESDSKLLMQSSERSHIVETESPEKFLENLKKTHDLTDGVLTLTPDVGLEILKQIKRKGKNFLLDYKDGWLKLRLVAGKLTVLLGEMPAALFDALESLIYEQAHLYTNSGREVFSGKFIWIKPKTNPSPQNYQKTELKLSYTGKIDYIQKLILANKTPVFELLGPPGSGKTIAIDNAVANLRSQKTRIKRFNTTQDYINWRSQHPRDSKKICILQLDDCRLAPSGSLEFLRDIIRDQRIYWQGEWFAAPIVALTNNPESDFHNDKHALFKEFNILRIEFSPFNSEEINEYILQPLLSEIKIIRDITTRVGSFILSSYEYVIKNLPKVCISSRELTFLCQRLKILFLLKLVEHPLSVCARACYEEFFGLFPNEDLRQNFWQFLTNLTGIKVKVLSEPIIIDQALLIKLAPKNFYLTRQAMQTASLIKRLLQMREQYLKINTYPGKTGLLLEGPPGILKTELTLAVLETTLGKNSFFNLVAGNARVIEQQLHLAHQQKRVVVCNELNALKFSTIKILMKLLENKDFFLIATQNPAAAGSERQNLLPALKNRLQVIYLSDYHQLELVEFTKNFNLQDGTLLVALFLALKQYQQQFKLALANPRHFFRWLDQLAELKHNKNSLTKILQTLIKIACNPTLPSNKNANPGQFHAAEYILKTIPAKIYTEAKLTSNIKLTLIQSGPKSEVVPIPQSYHSESIVPRKEY